MPPHRRTAATGAPPNHRCPSSAKTSTSRAPSRTGTRRPKRTARTPSTTPMPCRTRIRCSSRSHRETHRSRRRRSRSTSRGHRRPSMCASRCTSTARPFGAVPPATLRLGIRGHGLSRVPGRRAVLGDAARRTSPRQQRFCISDAQSASASCIGCGLSLGRARARTASGALPSMGHALVRRDRRLGSAAAVGSGGHWLQPQAGPRSRVQRAGAEPLESALRQPGRLPEIGRQARPLR